LVSTFCLADNARLCDGHFFCLAQNQNYGLGFDTHPFIKRFLFFQLKNKSLFLKKENEKERSYKKTEIAVL
jgi:hypothetical protein